MKSKRYSVPFINEFGQVISPGDAIVYLTTGRARQSRVRLGNYLALNRLQDGTITSVRVEATYKDYNGKTRKFEMQTKQVSLFSKHIFPTIVNSTK